MRRTAVLVAAAALALAACGGDDDEPPAAATPAPTEAVTEGPQSVPPQAPTAAPTQAPPTNAPTETPTEPGPAAVPTQAPTEEAPAAVAQLQVFADPGGANIFTETEFVSDAGNVSIEFSNQSSTPHAVEIEGVDGSKTATVTGADAPPVVVKLATGEYTIFCPVRGHRAAGMEAKLVVR